MEPLRPRPILRREIPKSAAGAVAAAFLPSLFAAHQATADIARPLGETLAAMAPMVFMNALMSTLIPAFGLVRIYRRRDPAFRLTGRRIAYGLGAVALMAGGSTLIVEAAIMLLARAAGVTQVTASASRWMLLVQGVVVAVGLTSGAIMGGVRCLEDPSWRRTFAVTA